MDEGKEIGRRARKGAGELVMRVVGARRGPQPKRKPKARTGTGTRQERKGGAPSGKMQGGAACGWTLGGGVQVRRATRKHAKHTPQQLDALHHTGTHWHSLALTGRTVTLALAGTGWHWLALALSTVELQAFGAVLRCNNHRKLL